MNQLLKRFSKGAIVFYVGLLAFAVATLAQVPADQPTKKPAEKSGEKTEEPPNAAQIELLETKYRFETDGDSRKEVHALVKINSELGVRQFARLNFDYNRSFQSVEIPLARITHGNGGTSDILPSAITDVPNPAVEKFPAYHDVRVKSVRILGLQTGDTLEYRVITTTTKPPLAPDFWLDHSFDRSGVVSAERFELDLPTSKFHKESPISGVEPPSKFIDVVSGVQAWHGIEPTSVEFIGDGEVARTLIRWSLSKPVQTSEDASEPDISATSATGTLLFSLRFVPIFYPKKNEQMGAFGEQVGKIIGATAADEDKLGKIYDFVSKQIRTVELPLGSTGFSIRNPADTLSSGYATPEDKILLLETLCKAASLTFPEVLLVASRGDSLVVRLNPFFYEHILVSATYGQHFIVMDPSVEVAPIGLIPASLRGNPGITLHFSDSNVTTIPFRRLNSKPLFSSSQKVFTESTVTSNGTLKTKSTYSVRGDNELLLRVAFHKTPKEKQQEIAQYLALSDGFRGKVTSVKTSDPYETDKPFEVEYELTQEKFVDWSKKPVRIPALLPLPGLPDITKKPAANSKIDLGTPLDITLSGTLRLPPGTIAAAPAGTSVKRDYATFTSSYSSKANVIRFSRHVNFLLEEIPIDRSIDLNAFIHAIQSDQSQLFVLDKPESVPPAKPK